MENVATPVFFAGPTVDTAVKVWQEKAQSTPGKEDWATLQDGNRAQFRLS